MADDDNTRETPSALYVVDELVTQLAAHMTEHEREEIRIRAYELVADGQSPDSATETAFAEEESRLIDRGGFEDSEHLLAARHLMAADPSMQVPVAEAMAAGASRKDALMGALRARGVDVTLAGLRAALAATTESSTGAIGAHYEALEAADEQGDEVGVAREKKRTREALSDLDDDRLDPHTVEVPAVAHRDAGKEPDRRESQAPRLARYRTDTGAPGGADPVFDVPLLSGGVVAALMRADLRTQAGAAHFCRKFSWPNGTPTLEQLRSAKAIALALEQSIMGGRDLANWELVARARDALDATLAKRAAVIGYLERLRGYWQRETAALAKRPNLSRPRGTGVKHRASKTLEELAHRCDAHFGSVKVTELVALVGQKQLAPTGIAVKLSLACGAFGDGKRTNETDAAAGARVKKLYEKALKAVPTS